LKITNKKFISRDGGSTGSVLLKMAAAAILDFKTMLPFLCYLANLHQI